MTYNLSQHASETVYLVSPLDAINDNPSVSLAWAHERGGAFQQVDDNVDNDIIIKDLFVSVSSTKNATGGSEDFRLQYTGSSVTRGDLNGKTSLTYETVARGLTNSQTDLESPTSSISNKKEHTQNSVCHFNESFGIKDLLDKFKAANSLVIPSAEETEGVIQKGYAVKYNTSNKYEAGNHPIIGVAVSGTNDEGGLQIAKIGEVATGLTLPAVSVMPINSEVYAAISGILNTDDNGLFVGYRFSLDSIDLREKTEVFDNTILIERASGYSSNFTLTWGDFIQGNPNYQYQVLKTIGEGNPTTIATLGSGTTSFQGSVTNYSATDFHVVGKNIETYDEMYTNKVRARFDVIGDLKSIIPSGYFGDSTDGAYTGGMSLTRGRIYNFSSFNLNSTISVTGNGPILIFVDGDMSIGNSGRINSSSSLISLAWGTSMNIHGNTIFTRLNGGTGGAGGGNIGQTPIDARAGGTGLGNTHTGGDTPSNGTTTVGTGIGTGGGGGANWGISHTPEWSGGIGGVCPLFQMDIIFVCSGNVYISSGAFIVGRGEDGSDGENGSSSSNYAGGGGGGGGGGDGLRVQIAHSGTFENHSNNLVLNGGNGGSGGTTSNAQSVTYTGKNGANGADGSINSIQL